MARKNKKSQTKKIPTRKQVKDFLACAPRSRRSRRAQMEAIGITIIVVLVLIGVLFGIQFVIKQKPVSVGSDFKRSQVAANFLSTLAETTIDCNGLSFSQLAQYCETKGTSAPCNACITAGEVARAVIIKTLDAWNMQYNLTVKKSNLNIEILYPLGVGCPNEKQTKQYSIPVSGIGTVLMQLDLC